MVTESVFKLYNKKTGLNNKSVRNKIDLELKKNLKRIFIIYSCAYIASQFAAQSLELNSMRKALEEDHGYRHKVMQKAYMENNRTSAQEKADRDRTAKLHEEAEKKNHMDYNTAHDFYTENTATCQSQLAPHRVIPYHWKGMNEHQRSEILHEQDKQRKETENIKNMKREEERLYALQAEHQRKMQIQMEREKVRRREELLRNQKEFNLLKNEEQQIKIKTMYG